MLTILNMLIVDLAFCERLYLCDFDRGSRQSREVVQTFLELHFLTELLIGCGTSGIPRKFKAEGKNLHVPAPPKCQASRVKIIELCYLNIRIWIYKYPYGRSFAFIWRFQAELYDNFLF